MCSVLRQGEESAVKVQEDARTGASVGRVPKRRPSLSPWEDAQREACVRDVPTVDVHPSFRKLGAPDSTAGIVAE